MGIELETADGKNDGAVNGVQYFQCRPNHGMFVKLSQVSVATVTRLCGYVHDNMLLYVYERVRLYIEKSPMFSNYLSSATMTPITFSGESDCWHRSKPS